jgi:hypothetical protein
LEVVMITISANNLESDNKIPIALIFA